MKSSAVNVASECTRETCPERNFWVNQTPKTLPQRRLLPRTVRITLKAASGVQEPFSPTATSGQLKAEVCHCGRQVCQLCSLCYTLLHRPQNVNTADTLRQYSASDRAESALGTNLPPTRKSVSGLSSPSGRVRICAFRWRRLSMAIVCRQFSTHTHKTREPLKSKRMALSKRAH